MRLAVLASGTGSILDAMVDAGLPVNLMVTDRPCLAVQRAAARGIRATIVGRGSFGDDFNRDEYTRRLGFGTVLAQPAYDTFAGRILNTHPALLPAFPGWHAVEDALAHGVRVTGCTVHMATLEVDSGPILAQEAVPVLPDDDVESLHERIKTVERRLYPETIRAVMDNAAGLIGGTA